MKGTGDLKTDQAIVVGFGSIGMRHAELLSELGLSVTVVSRRDVGGYPHHSDLTQAVKEHPEAYVVIANETSEHGKSLLILQSSGHCGPVLVEKPLFADIRSASKLELIPEFQIRIFIGYNLRFHPLLSALRERLAGLRIHTIEAAVGQYLPDWRPTRDYRTGYSASRAGGGGVLRDLSHEVDYMLWLFGPWSRLAALTGRSGELELDTEDFAHLLIQGRDFSAATLGLDYLDRNIRRSVTVNHDAGTTRLDFIAGTLTQNGETLERVPLHRNHTYREQHLAILRGDSHMVCRYQDGLATLHAVEAVERAVKKGEWVSL